MQGGGGGGGGIVELARKAAASARTERAARLAARRPAVRNYRGVHRRANRYYSVIWSTDLARLVWLGSYDTPEEAAYAYDAAARAIRGHRAMPNFPEPASSGAAPAPAPEEVSTYLALGLPTPAAPAQRFQHQQQPVALHPQACFDNWLAASAGAEEPQDQQQGAPAPSFPHHHHQQQQQRTVPLLPPFTQFFHLSGPATAAAAANGDAAAVVNPSVPGAYILTQQNVQVPPTNPASTELSRTEPVVDALQFLPAAAPTQHRQLPASQASGVSDLAVVADNFTAHNGASSSAAPPPVPRFMLDLLLQVGLPGRGGPGGA